MKSTWPPKVVDWMSYNAASQFKLWRKEVERIKDRPLTSRLDRGKPNHIYIWAGAHAEPLAKKQGH